MNFCRLCFYSSSLLHISVGTDKHLAVISSGMSQRDGNSEIRSAVFCSHSRKVGETQPEYWSLSHIQIDGSVDSCGELFSWPWDSVWLKPLETTIATLIRFIAHNTTGLWHEIKKDDKTTTRVLHLLGEMWMTPVHAKLTAVMLGCCGWFLGCCYAVLSHNSDLNWANLHFYNWH